MLTQERLKEVLYYNEDTGIFTKLASSSIYDHSTIGIIVGYIEKNGYRRIQIDGVRYSAHRLVFFYLYNKWPEHQVDHLDHNKDNNCLANLKEVTHLENQKNRSLNKNNKSGVSGVSFYQNKWKAFIGRKFLGSFINITDAIAIRKAAEIEHGYHQNNGKKLGTL